MYISETDSTNLHLRRNFLDREDGFCLQAGYQTSGRGQEGNGWESERNANLLFSLLLRYPQVTVERQFAISMWISVLLVRTLREYLPEKIQEEIRIKWPNDIYWNDSKIAGILIENILAGKSIARSIIGIGLNVNQTIFVSNAPNPISLKTIIGQELDCNAILEQIICQIKQNRELLEQEHMLKEMYMSLLYRNKGFFPYIEREVSAAPTMNLTHMESDIFEAEIYDTTPQGELILRMRDGILKTYHFKQIRYVILKN